MLKSSRQATDAHEHLDVSVGEPILTKRWRHCFRRGFGFQGGGLVPIKFILFYYRREDGNIMLDGQDSKVIALACSMLLSNFYESSRTSLWKRGAASIVDKGPRAPNALLK